MEVNKKILFTVLAVLVIGIVIILATTLKKDSMSLKGDYKVRFVISSILKSIFTYELNIPAVNLTLIKVLIVYRHSTESRLEITTVLLVKCDPACSPPQHPHPPAPPPPPRKSKQKALSITPAVLAFGNHFLHKMIRNSFIVLISNLRVDLCDVKQ